MCQQEQRGQGVFLEIEAVDDIGMRAAPCVRSRARWLVRA